MPTVVWSHVLALGHQRIDAEHKALIELAGEIEDLIDRGGDVASIADRLAGFHRLLVLHCAYEERLMGALPADTYRTRVAGHCHGHAMMIEQARLTAELAGQAHCRDDALGRFGTTVITMLKDLILDDAELIGALILEGQHSYRSAARDAARAAAAGYK